MAIGILFVCTGNTCRSPMAAGVFRALVERAGTAECFVVGSSGIGAGRKGQPASRLAIEAAGRRGYDIDDHRARGTSREDLARFDLPLAMERTHLAALRALAPIDRQDRPILLMKFAPQLGVDEVPDPYGGPAAVYEQVLDLIETACNGLFESFRSELTAARSS